MTGYEALSLVYDDFTQNVDYQKRCEYIDKMFKRNNIKGIVLDAGCGTGTLTLLLAKCGYDMLGVDISDSMLSRAFKKMHENGCDIRWLNQDLCKLDLFGTIVGVTCMQDTINHIDSKEKLSEVIRRFSLFMEQNGILIFDINTPFKHKEILSDNTFVLENEQSFCVWQNEYQQASERVLLTVDVFDKQDGLYKRCTDRFYEYTYDLEFIYKLLVEHNFELIEAIDGENYCEATKITQRIIISARKKTNQ